MSEKQLTGLEMARQEEGESTRTFCCRECSDDNYLPLHEWEIGYEDGYRFKCLGCGLLMKQLKPYNINCTVGFSLFL